MPDWWGNNVSRRMATETACSFADLVNYIPTTKCNELAVAKGAILRAAP
jgi:hypothetical protein